eukprot:GDKI01049089.1.p1 GENE.GDKI01049089.1~~GDKI01049089.1.p1  ORF type:complete len:1114 (+),score=260.80 GDKI01049089.1:55-3396(+)
MKVITSFCFYICAFSCLVFPSNADDAAATITWKDCPVQDWELLLGLSDTASVQSAARRLKEIQTLARKLTGESNTKASQASTKPSSSNTNPSWLTNPYLQETGKPAIEDEQAEALQGAIDRARKQSVYYEGGRYFHRDAAGFEQFHLSEKNDPHFRRTMSLLSDTLTVSDRKKIENMLAELRATVKLECGSLTLPMVYPDTHWSAEADAYSLGASVEVEIKRVKLVKTNKGNCSPVQVWALQGGAGAPPRDQLAWYPEWLHTVALSASKVEVDPQTNEAVQALGDLEYYIPGHRGVGNSTLLYCPSSIPKISCPNCPMDGLAWVNSCWIYLTKNKKMPKYFSVHNAAEDLYRLASAVKTETLAGLDPATASPQCIHSDKPLVMMAGDGYGGYWLQQTVNRYPTVADKVILSNSWSHKRNDRVGGASTPFSIQKTDQSPSETLVELIEDQCLKSFVCFAALNDYPLIKDQKTGTVEQFQQLGRPAPSLNGLNHMAKVIGDEIDRALSGASPADISVCTKFVLTEMQQNQWPAYKGINAYQDLMRQAFASGPMPELRIMKIGRSIVNWMLEMGLQAGYQEMGSIESLSSETPMGTSGEHIDFRALTLAAVLRWYRCDSDKHDLQILAILLAHLDLMHPSDQPTDTKQLAGRPMPPEEMPSFPLFHTQAQGEWFLKSGSVYEKATGLKQSCPRCLASTRWACLLMNIPPLADGGTCEIFTQTRGGLPLPTLVPFAALPYNSFVGLMVSVELQAWPSFSRDPWADVLPGWTLNEADPCPLHADVLVYHGGLNSRVSKFLAEPLYQNIRTHGNKHLLIDPLASHQHPLLSSCTRAAFAGFLLGIPPQGYAETEGVRQSCYAFHINWSLFPDSGRVAALIGTRDVFDGPLEFPTDSSPLAPSRGLRDRDGPMCPEAVSRMAQELSVLADSERDAVGGGSSNSNGGVTGDLQVLGGRLYQQEQLTEKAFEQCASACVGAMDGLTLAKWSASLNPSLLSAASSRKGDGSYKYFAITHTALQCACVESCRESVYPVSGECQTNTQRCESASSLLHTLNCTITNKYSLVPADFAVCKAPVGGEDETDTHTEEEEEPKKSGGLRVVYGWCCVFVSVFFTVRHFQ